MHTPKAISGAGGIDLVFSNQFHLKKGRRPYMDSFAFLLRGAKHSPPWLLALESPLSHHAWLVSAQAEVGKRKAKLKRRKDTNLWRYSALLSGITLCCCVRQPMAHVRPHTDPLAPPSLAPTPQKIPTVPQKRRTVSALHPTISQRIKRKRSCRNCLLVTKQWVRD